MLPGGEGGRERGRDMGQMYDTRRTRPSGNHASVSTFQSRLTRSPFSAHHTLSAALGHNSLAYLCHDSLTPPLYLPTIQCRVGIISAGEHGCPQVSGWG